MWTQRPVSTLTPWTISLFRLTNQLVFNVHCLLFQDCEIKPCPTCSYPGLWVQPMLDLEGAKELQTYILKATPTTPTEPQKNWTFRKFVQKCHEMAQKWPKMILKGPKITPKWPKITPNGPKWPKYDSKWPKMTQNGPKMTKNDPKMIQNGPNLPQMAKKWRPDLHTFSAIFRLKVCGWPALLVYSGCLACLLEW